MKSTVYIHPGLPKTGTTAIQIFLRDNQERLAQKGVAYPIFSRRFAGVRIERNGHFLSQKVTDSDFKEACLQEVISLADKYEKIVLTDEELWSHACDKEEFWTTLKNRLAEHDIDLKMIVYLRRQDAFMASLWAQKIKGVRLCSFTFKTLISNDLFDVDYDSYLKMVASVIGKENIIVRPYEFSQFEGKDNSIVSDFLVYLGVDYDDSLVFNNERVNLSLGGIVLEVKRHMNRVPLFRSKASKAVPMFFEVQKEVMEKGQYCDYSTWKNDDRAKYLELFTEGNSNVAKEYLGREDGILFKDALPKNDPQNCQYSCKQLGTILKCIKKHLLSDPETPFSPSEVKQICKDTWAYIYANKDYSHKCPFFRKLKRKFMHTPKAE